MKLGAQVYSVRNEIQSPEDYGNTMKKLKALGYDTIQHAGVDIVDPYQLRDLTQEAGLEQICPNFTNEPLLEDPQKVIECLKILGCDSMMLPFVGCSSRVTLNSFLERWKPFEVPLLKLQDAGIRLCYHNHAFDIAPMSDWDGSFVDYLFEFRPEWEFILDVAWSEYAGVDTLAYFDKLHKRLNCVHFKDYTATITPNNQPFFCACGAGKVNLEAYARKVQQLGIVDVIVEQDNALEYPDPFGQMAASAQNIKKLF